MLGLVLTAGGARGAYQAGVLKRLGEIPSLREGPSPFRIVAGASAGAINGAMLAGRGGPFGDATRELARVWAELEVHQVFRTDALSLSLGGLALLRDFTLGSVLGGAGVRSLFDATPLHALLEREIRPRGIAAAIERGDVYAVAVTATSYHSGRSFTFVQGRSGHPIWTKSRRIVVPCEISLDHVRASAAIPIVFQPVQLASPAGKLWFGDGGLRLVTPLSPAIRLGATHVFAVGIRSSRAAEALSREEVGAAEGSAHAAGEIPCPPLSQICGVFMNAIFLDHLDTDIDHLRRMNELIQAYGGDGSRPRITARGQSVSEPMRVVSPLIVSPSEDLALVAQRFAHRMPRLVRFLLDGLGTPDAQSADLMSYLLFDRSYTRALVDIGYRDASEKVDEFEAFVAASRERPEPGEKRGPRRLVAAEGGGAAPISAETV